MRTMPRRITPQQARGNYRAKCQICCAWFLRSDLTRLPNGLLACREDSKGRTEVELDMANAMAAASRPARYYGEEP